MYTYPGANACEIGDSDVTTVDGKIHLHHLCLPSHDVVGHAVSTDGLTFAPDAPAIRTGSPGECDDDQIWTMHTVQCPKTKLYHMYYTTLSLKERGLYQRVALATSKDFVTWEKHDKNPIVVPKQPFYNDSLELIGRVAFRDPFVFIDDDGSWHMLVCASAGSGDRLRRGCVAHAVSSDGFDWELKKPLFAPCQIDDPETPSMLKHNGTYYLFYKEFRGP
ncbi:MAG: glycoside hydrolase family protein, partial [Planctomycetota bacterium]